MAAQKQTSRWGSFLSQAVSSVEARLDNILADDYENHDAPQQKEETKPPSSTAAPASPAKQSPAPSRTASTNRANDRLQERLARAMAAKAAAKKTDSTPVGRSSLSSAQGSPRQSMDAQSRASIESVDRSSLALKEALEKASSPRASQEVVRKSVDSERKHSLELGSVNGDKSVQATATEEVNGTRASTDSTRVEAPLSEPTPQATETSLDVTPEPESQDATPETPDPEQVRELKKTLEDMVLQHQEEIHGYVERIDALEAKLQYLARETTDAARQDALAAPVGSAEKKLAEKDQQIAQLMEEGKNLASTERKHRDILKKLRAKIAEDEKELKRLRTVKEKSDKEVETLRKRARQAEDTSNDLQKRLDQTQKEVNSLRPELRSKDTVIADLKTQLQKATEQADAMAAKVNDQAREQDRRRIAELEDSVAALQVEKNLVADRAKTKETELKEKAERAMERSKALELELKAEVQVMESKLEAMRIRAEEASSGATGDSQAKLLRQVETLQSQYSIASENWQGIETTLLGRISNLEKERDEALHRESDMRRKAREAAVRAKRHEEELEETKSKLPNMQEDVRSYRDQLGALTKRAEEAEAALAKLRAEFEKQKQAWEAEKEEKQQLLLQSQQQARQQQQPGNSDRRSWLEGLPGGPFRPDSPQLSGPPQRTFSTDFLGIQSLTSKVRKASAPSTSNSDAGGPEGGRPGFSRRPSAQPLNTMNHRGSGTVGSGGLFSPTADSPMPITPSTTTHPLDREQQQDHQQLQRADTFDSVEALETASVSPRQQQQGVVQDMVSVSTVAAGPSVQLVERMSAAIRRLESEKVAGREELARIQRQRDEARAEIVTLMREAESNKAARVRVTELETELEQLKDRYETTLELLGEKTEEVEELKGDVADVKAMYRELVERTIK